MTLLAGWAATWILIHRLISGGPLRGWLVARMGERRYLLCFALLSIACLAGMANAYANVKPIGTVPAAWLAVVVALVQLFATMLVVAGLSTRNPATAGMGNTAGQHEIVRGMVRVTRHPFLCGILLWSASHLLVRHDPAALLFFGSIGAVAAMGMWSIDRKRRLALGEAWLDFTRKTSMVPFAAIAAGRQSLVVGEIGFPRMIAAFALWFAMLWLHPHFGSGLPPLAPIGQAAAAEQNPGEARLVGFQRSVYQVRMPRPAKYDESSILNAAAAIVASDGPGAATIGAIGHAIGASSGSIYHRFQTRDELLGRLWLSKAAFFQDRWTIGLDKLDAEEAGLAAALSLPRTARQDFNGARIMLLHRREDFLSETWPPEMKAEAERLKAQVEDSLAQITRRLFGKNSAFARQVATFAVLDLPFSAVRRYVAIGRVPPPAIDDMVAGAYQAVISQHRRKR